MNIQRLEVILSYLNETDPITSDEIAQKIGCSERTIRNEIKELNDKLVNNGAYIENIRKEGYVISVNNREDYNRFIEFFIKKDNDTLESRQDRIRYILELLLTAEKYKKIDDLCEELFISKSAISQDLKEVRKVLEEYNLKLVSKPNYGVRVEGKEFDIRLCLAKNKINSVIGIMGEDKESKQKVKKIGEILINNFNIHNIEMPEVAFQNLIVHIYIAIERIFNDAYVPLEEEQLQNIKKENAFEIAEGIVNDIEEEFCLDFPESEIGYIAIHLLAKKMADIDNDETGNVVISDEINSMIDTMLLEVKKVHNIDFTGDLDLIIMLALHLIPFKVRLQYDIFLRNPMLKEIKLQFTQAYQIAITAVSSLGNTYNKSVREDEIGYFALHFKLALERQSNKRRKKNILIVCGTGRGTAQLLSYKFKDTFGKYIDKVKTCDALGVKNQNFEDIDYIASTVPINTTVPVPIIQVKTFLDDKDIKNVKEILSKDIMTTESSMNKYFFKDLFMTDVNLNTKEDVLEYMVKRIKEVRDDIDDKFLDAIYQREAQAVTEFGNFVAIPHPNIACSDETFVAICILKKPIMWQNQKVQFIYLMSLQKGENQDLQMFYRITSKFLMDPKSIKHIIQTKSYNNLLKIFVEIEKELSQSEEL